MRPFLTFVLLMIGASLCAQAFEDFDIFLKVETTPLKHQQSSGTCWSFATTSFIETEALRLGKEPIALSPIFYVAPTYLAKAEKYIQAEGRSYFDAGDLTFSVLDAYEKYGAVPETIYNGIIEGDWQHDHLEMDNLLLVMVESIGKSGYGRIKPFSWKQSVEGVLKAYLGSPPATFVYKNQLYSPQSFAKTHIGIHPADYLEITSYSHGNFFEMFALNIPANWNQNRYLNLPIDDFEKVIDHALAQGYSLAWDGDSTEPGFDFNAGILQLPKELEEGTISQELRQSTFEKGTTTDDHNMHIIGKARDKNDRLYYVIKNSEGDNKMKGYILMTSNALLLKTISVLVHHDALPTEIRNKVTIDPSK
ncbi:MAG: C1 family peptidase [Bacteroidota bacterium]